jgi:hypothetical protein
MAMRAEVESRPDLLLLLSLLLVIVLHPLLICTACRLYDRLHCPESPNHRRVSDGKRALVVTYRATPVDHDSSFHEKGIFRHVRMFGSSYIPVGGLTRHGS